MVKHPLSFDIAEEPSSTIPGHLLPDFIKEWVLLAPSFVFPLPGGVRSFPVREQGHKGSVGVLIPAATAPWAFLCYDKPGSLLAESHPSAGPPKAETTALISLKCRASLQFSWTLVNSFFAGKNLKWVIFFFFLLCSG